MYTIWKYNITPSLEVQETWLPVGATILSFGLDPKDNLCYWAQVDPSAPKEKHRVACVGTGWPLDIYDASNQYALHIGTVRKGLEMWHFFDLGADPDGEIFELVTLSGTEEAPAQ